MKRTRDEAKGRCWDGYEPVPGKKAYSDNSCEPVDSKEKNENKKKKKHKKKRKSKNGSGESETETDTAPEKNE